MQVVFRLEDRRFESNVPTDHKIAKYVNCLDWFYWVAIALKPEEHSSSPAGDKM